MRKYSRLFQLREYAKPRDSDDFIFGVRSYNAEPFIYSTNAIVTVNAKLVTHVYLLLFLLW